MDSTTLSDFAAPMNCSPFLKSACTVSPPRCLNDVCDRPGSSSCKGASRGRGAAVSHLSTCTAPRPSIYTHYPVMRTCSGRRPPESGSSLLGFLSRCRAKQTQSLVESRWVDPLSTRGRGCGLQSLSVWGVRPWALWVCSFPQPPLSAPRRTFPAIRPRPHNFIREMPKTPLNK